METIDWQDDLTEELEKNCVFNGRDWDWLSGGRVRERHCQLVISGDFDDDYWAPETPRGLNDFKTELAKRLRKNGYDVVVFLEVDENEEVKPHFLGDERSERAFEKAARSLRSFKRFGENCKDLLDQLAKDDVGGIKCAAHLVKFACKYWGGDLFLKINSLLKQTSSENEEANCAVVFFEPERVFWPNGLAREISMRYLSVLQWPNVARERSNLSALVSDSACVDALEPEISWRCYHRHGREWADFTSHRRVEFAKPDVRETKLFLTRFVCRHNFRGVAGDVERIAELVVEKEWSLRRFDALLNKFVEKNPDVRELSELARLLGKVASQKSTQAR